MRALTVKLLLFCILASSSIGMQQANADKLQEKSQITSIPMLSGLRQTAANQLQITYDQPVDKTKGITPTNYWIQSTEDETPTGIATLGKNDTVGANNSLTADKVSISAVDRTNQTFNLTFKEPITSGKAYKLIICYVTKPGAPPYSGDNGSAAFVGR